MIKLFKAVLICGFLLGAFAGNGLYADQYSGGSGDGWASADSDSLALGGKNVSISSAADQYFNTALTEKMGAAITITDTNGGAVTALYGLRIRIPDSFGMEWSGLTIPASTVVDTSDNNFSATAAPITTASVVPATLVTGITGNVTVAFTNVNAIPDDGKIVVTFPANFVFNSGATTAATSSTIGGSLAVSISGQVVTITRAGGASVAAGAQSITLSNIQNPVDTGTTGTYSLQTQNSLSYPVDSISGVTGSAIANGAALISTSVTPASLLSEAVGNVTANFTLANPIPASGKIIITFPSGYTFNSGGTTAATSTTLDGSLAVSITGQVVTITRSGGTQTTLPNHSITLSYIKNPTAGGSTGTYTIQTNTSSSDTSTGKIDIDNAVAASFISGYLTGTSITHKDASDNNYYIAGATVAKTTISFTTINAIAANGKIEVDFPSGYDLSGTLGYVSGNASSTVSVINGNTLVITVGTPISANTAVSIVVSGIKNPSLLGSTGTYTIRTKTASGALIDQGTASANTMIVPTLTLLTPSDASITLSVGQSYPITWSNVGTIDNNLSFYYSTDGGTNWNSITSGIANSPQSYSWTVPAVPAPGTTNKVKIQDTFYQALKDSSDSEFGSGASSGISVSGTGGSGSVTLAAATSSPILSVSSAGQVTQSNMRISSVNGTAFVDFSSAGVLTNYIGQYLVIKDSAGKTLQGYIKAAGTGETYGSELITGWSNYEALLYETLTVNANGHDINSAINTTADALAMSNTQSFTVGCLYKLTHVFTLNSGTAPFGSIVNDVGIATGEITNNSLSAGSNVFYFSGVSASNRHISFWNGEASNFSTTSTLKQVLTPSATGVTIVSTSAGTTYNWGTQDSGFDPNSASFTYEIRPAPFTVGSDARGVIFDPSTNSVWVTNMGSGTVSKLRASDGINLGTYGVGGGPCGIAFDSSTNSIWVANYYSSSVSKLRASDGTSLGTYAAGAWGIAFDSSTNSVWVGQNTNPGTLSKLRASDGVILGTYTAAKPWNVAFDSSTNSIWVANYVGPTVTKLRASDCSILGTYTVSFAPYDVAFDSSTNSIWVANGNSNNVIKLRASDGINLGTYAVGSGPQGIAFDSSTNSVWVANMGGSTVSKLRLSDGTKLAVYPAGSQPYSVAFDSSTNSIWVANGNSGTVTKIKALDTVKAGDYTVGTAPAYVTFDPSTNSVWVTNRNSNTVSKLRPTDGVSVGTFTVGSNPVGVAFDSFTNSIWVTNIADNTLSKLSTTDGHNIGTYTLGSGAYDVTFDSLTNSIWVTNYNDNTISKFRASDGAKLADYSTGTNPHGAALDPFTHSLWVANQGSNTVSKLRPTDGVSVGTYGVGSYPQGIAFDSITNSIWVANYGSATVSKLRASDGVNLGTYGVGAYPHDLALDPITNSIWVVNHVGATVSKLSVATGAKLADYPTVTGSSPFDIAFDSYTNSIWVTNRDNNTVSKYPVAAYSNTGTFTSRVIDTGASNTLSTVSYTASLPTGTNIQFQISGSSDNSTWTDFVGPGGTSATYFTSGQSIPAAFTSYRYLKYKVTLTTSSPAAAPTLSDVSIGFSSTVTAQGTITDASDNNFGVVAGGISSASITPPLNYVINNNFATGATPQGLAFDTITNSIWVANSGASSLTKLRVSDGANLGTYNIGTSPLGVAFESYTNSIWVANFGSAKVNKVRTTDGSILGTYTVGASPRNLTFDSVTNSIWITNSAANTISKIRPTDGVPVGTFTVGTSPYGIAFDSTTNSIWVANSGSNYLSKVRPTDGTTLATYATDVSPYGVAFDSSTYSIWAANNGSGTTTKVNVVSGGSIGQTNMKLSAVNGTAFVDFSNASKLTPYLGKYLVVSDSAGKKITGWIKSVGTGETLSAEIFTADTTFNSSTGWTLNGWTIGSGVATQPVCGDCWLYQANIPTSYSGKLYKVSFNVVSYSSDYVGFGAPGSTATDIPVSGTGNKVRYACGQSGGWSGIGFHTRNSAAGYVINNPSVKQVLTPATTGVTIVSTSDGTTYSWETQDPSFNRNDSGYTYQIYDTAPTSGTLTQANTKISSVAGTAFVDFSTAGTLTPFVGKYLVVTDSTHKRIEGWIKAAGTGETLGSEKNTSGATSPTGETNSVGPFSGYSQGGGDTFESVSTGTPSNGTYHIHYIENTEGLGGIANATPYPVTTGFCYKAAIDAKKISGSNIDVGLLGAADSGIVTSSSYATFTKYFTGVSGGYAALIRQNGSAGAEFYVDNYTLKQVLTPSTTGVTIVSTSAGSTYDWAAQDTSFNPNDTSGYTYQIYDTPPTTPTISQANTKLSLVNGTAFVDFSNSAALTPYIGKYLVITDSSRNRLGGWIKATGTGETLGNELVKDPGFSGAVPTDWGKVGTATVSGGTGNFAADSDRIYQTQTIVLGGLHKCVVGNFSRTGTPTLSFYQLDGNSFVNITAPYSGYKTAPSTGGNYAPGFIQNNAGTITIDNVSVTQVLTPSTTGVTIVSTSGGTTYNWPLQDTGFNPNDASGYTYQIYDSAPPTSSVTQANTKLSLVGGTAFADFSTADILTANIGKYLVVKDSSGYRAEGWIKAVGTGETYGVERILSWANDASHPFSTLTTSGTDITSIISTGSGDYANSNEPALSVGQLLLYQATWTKNSGANLQWYMGDTVQNRSAASFTVGANSTYFTPISSTGSYPYLIALKSNSSALNGSLTSNSLKQVLTPATTGVTIVSTKAGPTYNWTYKDSSFSPNDASGYTYQIYDSAPLTPTISRINTKLSLVSGTAFADFSTADILTSNIGKYLVVKDSSGYRAEGYIRAAGTGETYSAELVTDPEFNDASKWAVAAGWTISGGQATITNQGDYTGLYDNDTLSSPLGKLYKCVAVINSVTQGTIFPSIQGDAVDGLTSAQTYTGYRCASKDNTTLTAGYFGSLVATTAVMESFSLKQVTAPSTTGVTIVSTKAGPTYNWTYKDSSFDPNSAAFTYEIFAAPPTTNTGGTSPIGICFDSATSSMWVANSGSGNVSRLRVTDGASLGTFNTGAGAFGVSFDTYTGSVWVTNSTANTVTKISPSLAAGAVGNVGISLTTANPIPADGKIIITFPAGFALSSGATTTATSLTIDGTLTVGINGQVVTITRSGGTATPAGNQRITLSNVKNPTTAGTTGTYSIETQTAASYSIDKIASIPGSLIISASSSSLTLNSPDDITAGGSRAAYTLTRYDQFNNLSTSIAETFYLYTTSSGVNAGFYGAATGGSKITSITIGPGASAVNVYYYDEKMGAYTITASDNATAADGASGIADATDALNVKHAIPDHLKFVTNNIATQQVSVAFTLPQIVAVDAYDNTLTNDYSATAYSGSKTISYILSGASNAPDNNANDDFTGATPVTFTNGVSPTPSTLSVILYRSQATTLTAKDITSGENTLPGTNVASNQFTVNPLGAVKLAFKQQPSTPAIINANFATPPKVSIRDTYGNQTADTHNIRLQASTRTTPSFLAAPGTLTTGLTDNIMAATNGEADYASIQYSAVGDIYLYATDTTNTLLASAYSVKVSLNTTSTSTVEAASPAQGDFNLIPTYDNVNGNKFIVLKFKVHDNSGDVTNTLIDQIKVAIAGTAGAVNAPTDMAWAGLYVGATPVREDLTATIAKDAIDNNYYITFGSSPNSDSSATLYSIPEGDSVEFTVYIYMKHGKLTAVEGNNYTFGINESNIGTDLGTSSRMSANTSSVTTVTGTIQVNVSAIEVATSDGLSTATATAGSPIQLMLRGTDANKNIDIHYTGNHNFVFSGLDSAGVDPDIYYPTINNYVNSSSAQFGSLIAIPFSNGCSTISPSNAATLTAYKAQAASVLAQDTDHTAYSQLGLSITVNAAAAHTIAAVGATSQSGSLNQALPVFTAGVTDIYTNPVSAVPVIFTVTNASGATGYKLGDVANTHQLTVNTGSNGQAAVTLTLGNQSGAYPVTAAASLDGTALSGSPVNFSATAYTLGSIQIDSGNNQSGQVTALLTLPLKVKVVDNSATPLGIQNQVVTFAISAYPNGATLYKLGTTDGTTQISAITDTSGFASTTFTLGTKSGILGAYKVTASSGNLTPAEFSAAATPKPATKVAFVPTLVTSVKAGIVSDTFTIATQDEYSNNSNLVSAFSLSSSSGSGLFYSNSAGTGATISSVNIASGSTATFWYKDAVTGSANITVTQTSPVVTPAPSAVQAISIVPGNSGSFKVTGDSHAADTIVTGEYKDITISLYDDQGNKMTDFNDDLAVVLSGAAPAPSGQYATCTDKNNAAQNFGSNTTLDFTAGDATARVRLYKAETPAWIKVSIPGTSVTTVNNDTFSFTVRHGDSNHLKFDNNIVAAPTAGQRFELVGTGGVSIHLNAVDTYDNTCDGANGSTAYSQAIPVSFKLVDENGADVSLLSPDGADKDKFQDQYYNNPTTITFSSGVSGVTLSAQLYYAKAVKIVASSSGYLNGTNVPSNLFTVISDSATKLTFNQQPSSSCITSQALAQQPKVAAADQYGNPFSGTPVTVDLAAVVRSSDNTAYVAATNGALSPAGNLSVATASGIATYSGLTYNYPETIFLMATVSGASLTPAYSSQIAFSTASDTTLTAGALVKPTTISALANTSDLKVNILDFVVTDAGTDGYSTVIKQIALQRDTTSGTPDTTTGWLTYIAGASITDGTTVIPSNAVENNQITFGTGNDTIYSVAKGNPKTFNVSIYLKTTLPAHADGKVIALKMDPSANITLAALSSKFSPSASVITASPAVSVVATNFIITGSSIMNAGEAQNISIKAVDTRSNIDWDYTGDKYLTFSGASLSPNSYAATINNTAFGTETSINFKDGLNNAASSAVEMKLYTAEVAVIKATDTRTTPNLSTANSSALGVTVSGGSATSLSWLIQPQAVIVENAPWAGFSVTAADTYGNTSSSTTEVTVTPSAGTVVTSSGATVNAQAGVATFYNFAIKDLIDGQKITVTAAMLDSQSQVIGTVPSSSVTVYKQYVVTYNAKDYTDGTALTECQLKAVKDGITVAGFPMSGNSPFSFSLPYGIYTFTVTKDKYVDENDVKTAGADADYLDGKYDDKISWTVNATSLVEATSDYLVGSAFVYDESTDKLSIRAWINKRGKLVVSDSANSLGAATINIYNDATSTWLTPITIANNTGGVYLTEIANVVTNSYLASGKTYFAKVQINYGGVSGDARAYEAGTTFSVTVSQTLKSLTSAISTVTANIASQTSEIKSVVKDEIKKQVDEVIVPKITDVKTETAQILTATGTESLQTKLDEVKTQVVNEVQPSVKSGILNRETAVKQGATIKIRYRTTTGLTPYLNLYSPRDVLLLSSKAMTEVGVTGIYEYSVAFISGWGVGDFTIICSEPTKGTVDALVITVRQYDIESVSNDVSAIMGSTAGITGLKGVTDTIGAQFTDMDKLLTKISKDVAGKLGDAKSAVNDLASAFKQLEDMSKQIKDIGGTTGINLEKLYEVSKDKKEDITYIKNKSEELKAAMEINQKMIENVAKKPVVQTWFEFK